MVTDGLTPLGVLMFLGFVAGTALLVLAAGAAAVTGRRRLAGAGTNRAWATRTRRSISVVAHSPD